MLAMLRQWIADALFRLSGDRPAPEALPALPHQNVPVASVAATSLERHVSASPIGKTYLIAIDVTSSDPVKAAIIANSVADHYIADRISSRIETSEAASAAIHSRLTELGERLRRGEMALAQFKAKTGLLQTLSASGSPAPILQHELSDTSTQLNDARSLEAKLAAKLAQLTSAKGGGASGEALASPLIQQLREQEATLAAQYAQITTRLGPNHPTTKETEHALAAVRGQIGNATSDIRRSVAADLAGVHGQEQLLQARLAALRTRISGEAGEEAQLASLQSDVDFEPERLRSVPGPVQGHDRTTPSRAADRHRRVHGTGAATALFAAFGHTRAGHHRHERFRRRRRRFAARLAPARLLVAFTRCRRTRRAGSRDLAGSAQTLAAAAGDSWNVRAALPTRQRRSPKR